MVAFLIGGIALASAAPGAAVIDNSGTYLCTVVEKASIGALHLVGSGPPTAQRNASSLTRYKLRISAIDGEAGKFRMVEEDYKAADRDRTAWHTRSSVLHGEYRGDGKQFVALKDQAFFRFRKSYRKPTHGDFKFYHAGFEYPGGEDTKLSARWGQCRKV